MFSAYKKKIGFNGVNVFIMFSAYKRIGFHGMKRVYNVLSLQEKDWFQRRVLDRAQAQGAQQAPIRLR